MLKQSKVSSYDRFIPRRSSQTFDFAHYELTKSSSSNIEPWQSNTSKYVNLAQRNFNKEAYVNKLSSIVLPKTRKILNISEHRNDTSETRGKVECELWPRTSRKRPLIGSPSIILDMPNLETNVCHHIVDWSSKGFLATVYDREVYLWHHVTEFPSLLTNTDKKVANCVKWNKRGNYLAIALQRGYLAVRDFYENKTLFQTICVCLVECTVTAIEWSTNNSLITGCSRGRLSVWSFQGELIRTIFPAHAGAIVTVKLSKAEQRLVTTGVDGTVRLWIWPHVQEHFEINYSCHIKAIDWHPWKDSLLCLAEYETGTLRLWNTNTCKEVSCSKPQENALVDCLTWNKLSGELVVSYSSNNVTATPTGYANKIIVYSSFDAVVDAIEWHVDRVPYLLWGKKGTQLATASADENLCIWNFFGSKPDKEMTLKLKRRKKLRTNAFENLSVFGMCIR